MLREAALQPDDLVVEVGCGTGRMTLPLSAMTPARVTGVDAETRMLDVARAKDAAGRIEWKATGDWGDYSDFTARANSRTL